MSAREVDDMPLREWNILQQWADKWLPHVLYGSDAAESEAKRERGEGVLVTDRFDALPGAARG